MGIAPDVLTAGKITERVFGEGALVIGNLKHNDYMYCLGFFYGCYEDREPPLDHVCDVFYMGWHDAQGTDMMEEP